MTSKPASMGGPSLFVTSNQCASCHDATNNAPMPTHMLYTPPGASAAVNLSTAGEWRYSMMGLSGRDPIFFAQVDTESTIHGKIKGKPNPPGFVQDTCLSCHGVMGQRQFHLDKGNGPKHAIHPRQLQDPTSPYGALARDGVSCAVCHHMADDQNLDDPSFYTGKFIRRPCQRTLWSLSLRRCQREGRRQCNSAADDKLCGNSTDIWSSGREGSTVRLLPHDRAPGL